MPPKRSGARALALGWLARANDPSLARRAHAPALLERSSELEAMDDALAAARTDAGVVLLVEGSAGVGKTRLLGEAAARAAGLGMSVRAARGSELEGEFAWGVVRRLFEPLLAALPRPDRDDLLADAAALAAPALGLSGGRGAGADASFSTLHSLYWLATNLARRTPLLLLVDDVHWADAPSLRFLAFLTARLEGCRSWRRSPRGRPTPPPTRRGSSSRGSARIPSCDAFVRRH
jgi:AAA ATPase domain